MEVSTTIISDNVALIRQVYANRTVWMHEPDSVGKAIDLLNEFDMMTYNNYWLTVEEECLLDNFADFLEAAC